MKKTLSLVLATVMVLALNVVPAAAVNETEITYDQIRAAGDIIVDGVRLDTQTNDNIGYFWVDSAWRTQAPVRLLVEAMTFDITYKDNVVTIPGGPNGDVVITIGSDELKVGANIVKMDTTAVIINNRTYVPLRFVAEALNAKVETGSYTENLPWIKVTTTFRPERTINGVAQKPFTQCTNVQKFLEANKDLFTYSDAGRLTMEYSAPDGLMLKLDFFETGEGYYIEGMAVGDAYTGKQYELICALIDDVVEESSRQAIKDKIKERNDILADGWTPDKGITEKAMAWQTKNDYTTTKIGNVNMKWSKYTNAVTFSIAE